MVTKKENKENGVHHDDVAPKVGHMSIGVQYVKDLSFENPKAPKSLMTAKNKPKIELEVDAHAHPVQGSHYEVALHIVARAVAEKEVLFLCDLTYCGLFTLVNVPEKEKEPALLVHGSNMLYPFARRVIADLTRDGGFPTLMLEPIDFGQIYMQKKQQILKTKADGSKKTVGRTGEKYSSTSD